MTSESLLESSKEYLSGLRRSAPARVAFGYMLFGLGWMLVTDLLLYRFVTDMRLVYQLETAKGWLFISATTVFVYVLTAYSVAPLQRANALERAILRSIADGVLLVGKDTRIADANPAAVALLGVRSRDELVGMGAEAFSRRFHLRYDNGHIVPPSHYVSQRALRGETTRPYKARLRGNDGQERTIISTAAAVCVPTEIEPALVVSVMHDVTQLDSLEQMRNEFFAASAHALKTPISTIATQAQLLLRRAKSEETRASARAVVRQCARIDRLVQNLLVLSRLRDGSLQLHPGEHQLAPLLERTVASMRSMSTRNELKLMVEATPRVHADSERLRLSIVNLIEIALRQAESHSDVRVVLSQRNELARVAVVYHPSRTSCGSYRPLDDAARAQLDHERWTGLSLGRYVSQHLIEAQGGYVGHSSTEIACDFIELPILAAGSTAHVQA